MGTAKRDIRLSRSRRLIPAVEIVSPQLESIKLRKEVMNSNRKHWNDKKQKLRRALTSDDREKAVELFRNPHAMGNQ